MKAERPSVFARRFRYRANRFLPGPTRPPGLVTLLPVRPARFAVGLGEHVRWEHLAEARGAPLLPAFHLGQVEEVLRDEGLVLVTLRERPSGRESAAELSITEHFQGTPPMPNARLRLWTWMEIPPGGGEPLPRTHVQVEPVALTGPEREHLEVLIERLSQTRSQAKAEKDGGDGDT